MAPLSFLLFGTTFALFSGHATAQFGVPKRGTGFQDLNEMAQEGAAGMAGMDMDYLKNAMNDPALQDIMGEFAKMSPEELAKSMKDAVDLMTGDNYLDQALANPDEMLKNLEMSGMVTPEQLAEYKTDPNKLKTDINEAVGQLKDVFSGSGALGSMEDIASAVKGMMGDPSEMADLMKGYSEKITESLSDDDQIESARLELLANPELMAGNPMFDSEEMKDILNDPVKWRDTVKSGKDQLLGDISDGASEEL